MLPCHRYSEMDVSDNFFSKLDQQLDAAKSEEMAVADRKAADRAFSEKAIAELRPVATEYAAKLRERGISTRVSGSGVLEFEMRWADGGTHGLMICPDLDTGRLKIVRKSTDHTDGRRFSSSDWQTYGEDTWKPSTFESALESVINDYMSFAKHHGGIA